VKRIILLAALLAAFVVPASAQAHFISESSAESIAQSYQNGECGFATLWVCRSAYYIPQFCYAKVGYHTWYCEGSVSENDLIGGGGRVCTIDVHVYSDPPQISYHYNTCRH
jgi:hypothetical protein